MNMNKEVQLYDNMIETEDLIESIQGRVYGFTTIPLEERDQISKLLYEARMRLVDHSNRLGSSLVVMGAFD